MAFIAYVSLSPIPPHYTRARSRPAPNPVAATPRPPPSWLRLHLLRRPRPRMCSPADSTSGSTPLPSSQGTPSSDKYQHQPQNQQEQQNHHQQQQQHQLQSQQNSDVQLQNTSSPSASDLVTNQRSQAQLMHDSPGSDFPELDPGARRPPWAPVWLPNIFLELPRRPLLQLALLLPLYAIHLFIFSTKGFKLPRPLIPNDKKLFQSVGWDSVVGAVVAVVFLAWRRLFMSIERPVPPLLQSENPPWYVPRDAKRKIGQTTAFLVMAYLASGYGAVVVEGMLFLLASYGVPLTIATTRAWKVLLGHLMWVYMGIRILRRLQPFFPKEGTWLRWKIKANWLWWAIGGYYVSALFFNFADVINQLVLPSSLFEEETVVSKLINPENKDRIAMAIGSIGPCVSAPVFEEVLYRGFLLPALACFLPMWAAIPASSVLFALHHLNPTGILPLTVLGLIWAILYTKSRNLIVTILIHCMWNSRVFLGSLLGLGTFPDFE